MPKPTQTPANLPLDFYPTSRISEEYRVTRNTIHIHCRNGKLPKPTRYSHYYSGWPLSEIAPYLALYTKREVV